MFTEVIEEINALYDEETLDKLIEEAKSKQPPSPKQYRKLSVQEFRDAVDWKERLNLLDHMENPTTFHVFFVEEMRSLQRNVA